MSARDSKKRTHDEHFHCKENVFSSTTNSKRKLARAVAEYLKLLKSSSYEGSYRLKYKVAIAKCILGYIYIITHYLQLLPIGQSSSYLDLPRVG